MTTFRAAYIVAPQNSTSGGYLLTTQEQADLSDADLIAAALPELAEYNANSRAIGAKEAEESEIVIGEWLE